MVRIDEIDAELLPEEGGAPSEAVPPVSLDREALRELVRELLREELERFLRTEATLR